MQKKKIIFVLYSMTVGGVEKAFLNFLSVLPLSELDITLFLMEKKGDFLSDLPSSIRVIESSVYKKNKWMINYDPYYIVKELLRKKNIFQAFCFLILYFYRKVSSNCVPLYNYIFRKEIVLKTEYDLAVAYAGPSFLIDYFVAKRINAVKKIGWIHFDVEKFGFNPKESREIYNCFEHIFAVSDMAKEHFIKKMPHLSDKVETFYNVVSSDLIKELAEKELVDWNNNGCIRILTVGRISFEKGQNYAIEALKILVEKGYPVKWYFVGDGNFLKDCENLVMKYQLEEHVVFFGTKTNPYPYMKDCDIYVQPSRHEGFCITLAEAKVFDKPIIATDFAGAREQLRKRSNAMITGFTEEDIANGIIEVLEKKCPQYTGSCIEEDNNITAFMNLI